MVYLSIALWSILVVSGVCDLLSAWLLRRNSQRPHNPMIRAFGIRLVCGAVETLGSLTGVLVFGVQAAPSVALAALLFRAGMRVVESAGAAQLLLRLVGAMNGGTK